MPRRSAKKETKETPSKDIEDVKVVDQESTPRRSGRGERSRRGSTVAQTVVSVADSKGSKSHSSPSESRRSSAREGNVESPATRVKSARRAASRINYKESDGEEEVSTPKDEDIGSNFEESGSDDAGKQTSKKTKSSAKGRGAKQKGKSAGKRGRKPRKGEPVVVTDESADDFSDSEKKSKTETPKKVEEVEEKGSRSSRKKTKKSTDDSTTKPGRRSTRTPAVKEIQEPVNKRPSRNKQIKKYTEVDDDFSDAKSEDDEVVYETEVKRETSRKRKREAVDDASSGKKQKRQKSSKPKSDDDEDVEEVSETEENSKKDIPVENIEKKSPTKSEKSDTAESEEPMDIDEDPEAIETTEKAKHDDDDDDIKSEKDEKETKDDDEKLSNALVIDEQDSKNEETNEEIESDDAKDDSQLPKNEMEDTQHSKTSSQFSEEVEDSEEEEEENEPNVNDASEDRSLKPVEEDKPSDMKASVNCIDSKTENTFPTKDSPLDASVNGENTKPNVIAPCPPAPATDSSLQTNDLPPKQNGSHEIDSPQNFIASRRYIVNPSLTEDIRLSLKDKTFGIASYNLQGSEAVNKDKLVQELSKLQASIICFQDVSRALYHEVLESNLDMLGFKGTGSWLKGSQHTGLATFYKTSAFRLNASTEVSLQKLVEQEIDSSNIDENSRESFFRSLSKCGNALFLVLSAVYGDRQLIVGNVDLPSSNISLHTMQVSCLSHELVKLSEGVKKPLILCGELNLVENKIPYQLLRCGSLTEAMFDELKSKAESSSEAMAFESSLKRASLRPSCKMSSCYATVLGKELSVPSTRVTSSNLVWFIPDCLHTIGVLDVAPESPDADDYPVSLKADVAFSV